MNNPTDLEADPMCKKTWIQRWKEWLQLRFMTVLGNQLLQDKIEELRREIQTANSERARLDELRHYDLLLMFDQVLHFANAHAIRLESDHPIAASTNDHQFPRGTWNDNTRSRRFVYACERQFTRPFRYLDLGCAGGGLVLDFILRGHIGVGIEGSDVSQRAQRAEWKILPNNLLTGDISKPFQVWIDDEPGKFEVITAWEVLEHISNDDLPTLFSNIRNHLCDGGMFVGSIPSFQDTDPVTGVSYHQIVEPREWWEGRFRELGFNIAVDHDFLFSDFCRGVGNGPYDHDFRENPELGFHFVLSKEPASKN